MLKNPSFSVRLSESYLSRVFAALLRNPCRSASLTLSLSGVLVLSNAFDVRLVIAFLTKFRCSSKLRRLLTGNLADYCRSRVGEAGEKSIVAIFPVASWPGPPSAFPAPELPGLCLACRMKTTLCPICKDTGM